MKKVLAVLLAAMALFSVLSVVSCSNENATEEDVSSHFAPTASDGISVDSVDLSNILDSLVDPSELDSGIYC